MDKTLGPVAQSKSAIPRRIHASRTLPIPGIRSSTAAFLSPRKSLPLSSSANLSRIPLPATKRHDQHSSDSPAAAAALSQDEPDSPTITTGSNSHCNTVKVSVPMLHLKEQDLSQVGATQLPHASGNVARQNSEGTKGTAVVKPLQAVLKSETKIPLPSITRGLSSRTTPSTNLLVRSSRDNDMKQNLLSMLSKSEDKWRHVTKPLPLKAQEDIIILSSPRTEAEVKQSGLAHKPDQAAITAAKENIQRSESIGKKFDGVDSEANKNDSFSVSPSMHTWSHTASTADGRSHTASLGTHVLLPTTTSAIEWNKSLQLATSSTMNNTFKNTEISESTISSGKSLAQTLPSVLVSTKVATPMSASNVVSSREHPKILSLVVTSTKMPSNAAAVFTTSKQNNVTFVTSTNTTVHPSTGLSTLATAGIENEESGKSSDSLPSGESERNLVPLSEEFEDNKKVKAEPLLVSESSASSVSHCALPSHITDTLPETASLPDLNQQDQPESPIRRWTGSPSKQLLPWYNTMKAEAEQLRSQLKNAHGENEAQESRLRHTQKQMMELKSTSESLRRKVEREKGIVTSLKKYIEEQSLASIQLKREHTNEVTRIRKEMEQKQERERERLLNQIRELTKMKEQKNAKVNQLEGSLNEAKQMASASSTTLELTEVKYTTEIQELKTELQALQDLQKTSEEMCSSLSSKHIEAEKQLKRLLSENKTLAESIKDEKEARNHLQSQLQETEDYVTKLQKDKAEARADMEKQAIERNVKLEVKYQETIEDLKEKLEDMAASKEWFTQQLEKQTSSSQPPSRATTPRKTSRKVCQIKEQHQKIIPNVSARYLEDTVSSTNKKSSRLRCYSPERPHSTELTSPESHHRSSSTPCSEIKNLASLHAPETGVRDRGRNKTFPSGSSQRLSRNKQGGEVLIILGELKKEGYDATQATPDQIISYVWMKRKRAHKDLEEANKALREKFGDSQFRLLQEWKMEAEVKADKLRLAEQQLEIRGRTAKATQDLLKKKLEDLLQQSSEREESAYAEQKKSLTNSLMTENRSLKNKVAELRGEIMTKSASISQTEGDLSEFKRKNESMERELNFEMRQKALLEAKVDNLQKQLKQQMLKFNSLQEDSLNVTKGSQHRAEVGQLKVTIGKLEGEVSLLQQELTHERDEKENLQSQIETYSSQMLQLQSQTAGGNSTIVNLKTKMNTMTGDCLHWKEELERETRRCSLVEKDVEILRKSLHDAQRKNASLEAEFLRLRAEHKCTHQELADSTKSIVEIEKNMKLSAEDLQVNKELSKQLHDVVSVTKQELTSIRKKLEQEKQTNGELHETIHSLNKKMDGRNLALATSKKELSQKKLELQQLQQDKSTLVLDIEQLQSSMESMKRQLYHSQKDLKSAESAIEKKNATLMETQQTVDITAHQTESNKALIEDLRSKLTIAEAEIERLNAAKTAVTSENLEFRTKLTEIKFQLAERKSMFEKKEEEIISLKKEKSLIQQDLSDAKRESSSQKCVNSELENEVELKSDELEIERRNLQEVIEEFRKKSDEVKSLKYNLEDMETSMEALQEEKSTLEIELANIQGECMATKSLKKSLEQRLETCTKKSEEEEEYYHKSLDEIRSSLDHSQNELMTLAKKYSSLENEYRHNHALRESSENELAVLREEHHLVKGNLTSTVKVKKALEEKMESLQKQMDESMELLVEKTSELKQVQNTLSMTQTQLDDMEREIILHKNDLATTTENLDRLQIEDDHKAEKLRMLTHEIQKTREELQLERGRADANSDEATSLHSKCKELSEKLHQSEQELCEVQIAQEDSHANYINTVNSLKEQHEERIEELRGENNSLHAEAAQLNDQLFSKEREMSIVKEELDTATSRLTNAETKYMRQRAELAAKEDSHEILKSDHLQLESRSVEARVEITDLKGKLSSQITTNELLKSELNEMKRECSSLKEKLRMQRENATSSLNKIQQDHHEKSAQLRAKIQEMSEKINQVNASMLQAEREISKLQMENERLTNSLTEENDVNMKNRHELQEQMTSLKVLEHQVDQYQTSADIERNAKLEFKQNLADERAKRQNHELVIAEQEEKYNMVTRELCQVQKSYKKEESRNEKLKMEISQLKEEVMETKHHHDALNEQQKISKQQLEYEITSIRQKNHSDKKSLKEKIKVLQDNLQSSMEQLETRSRHIQSLESNARTLSDHIDELNRKLASSDERLQNKREECKKLRTKQHAFEIQVAQLQADIRGLENAQLQLEEFRKKAEAKSKCEIKRVLSEVSEQMEHQSTAQRYLEKLRSENELVAIKEKERVISELRNELKLTRHEGKKDRMHLEQLKMESLHLKNQQLEQDKSRRRLEARLEQVNDTLSKTLPTRHLRSLMTQDGPLFSSTPSPSRTFSGYRP